MKPLSSTPRTLDVVPWLIVLLLLIGTPIYVQNQLDSGEPYVSVTLALIVGFFTFHLWVRRSLAFQGYFSSPFNLLTAKTHEIKTYGLDRELLFEKMLEVLESSKFKVVDTDPERYRILALSGISWRSWGENLYFDLEARGEETVLHFRSTTLFQLVSWNKNEENYKDLLDDIEDAFTI